jgi:hypothetical protein
MGSGPSSGHNGVFIVPSPSKNGRTLIIIASDGLGWEHASIHVERKDGEMQTPYWEEMCFVKDLFWDEDDVVVQYHPAKRDYVNVHPNTLHLWRPTGGFNGQFMMPPLKLL